jgi:hypothetical protein
MPFVGRIDRLLPAIQERAAQIDTLSDLSEDTA